MEEAEEAVPDGGGYEEEEKEGGKNTVAEVAVEGTAVPLEEEGEGEGEGVARVEPPPAAAAAPRGVDVTIPPLPAPPPTMAPGTTTGRMMGFSCKMWASHSSLNRSISVTLSRKKE